MGPKSSPKCFVQHFFENPSGHARRRISWTSAPESAFSCGPGDGEKLLDPWSSGRKGQECPREIQTEKSMFRLLFLPRMGLSACPNHDRSTNRFTIQICPYIDQSSGRGKNASRIGL